MSLSLHYAARSDVGLTRENNQDSGYAGPHLLVLADGMGGAAAGDVASSVAVAHLAPLDGDEHSADEVLDLLRDALRSAHDDLRQFAASKPENAGLGTTVIALLRSGRTAAMVHIGDSRAYVLREGTLHQVTTDHSFVQHLVDTGQLSADEAETHPQRSVLLRVLGDSAQTPELDESVRELREGDRWLLCSDGLSGSVSAETIADTMAAEPDPGACADALVELALRAGGPDNITIVLADVRVDETDPGRWPDTTPQVVGAAAVDRDAPTRGGTSAAAKAAALAAGVRTRQLIEDGDDAEDVDAPTSRGPLFYGIASLVVLLLLAGATTLGYRWSQSQFYVAPEGEVVAIYRGVPQQLGPLDLSSVAETTALRMDALPPFVQQRVATGITAGSLEQAQEVVRGLEDEAAARDEQEQDEGAGTGTGATPDDDASATPSPDPSDSGTG